MLIYFCLYTAKQLGPFCASREAILLSNGEFMLTLVSPKFALIKKFEKIGKVITKVAIFLREITPTVSFDY